MGFPPEWALLLDAAGGDPLKAQEFEKRLDVIWWERWKADHSERAKAQNAKERMNV